MASSTSTTPLLPWQQTPLAILARIKQLHPILGKDWIAIASLEQVDFASVVKKSEFKEGDWVIFVYPDSVVPAIAEFDFLKKQDYRVLTRKIGEVYSHGLICSLNLLSRLNVDTTLVDWAGQLGVQKYSKPIPAGKEETKEVEKQIDKNALPAYIPKTGETNLLAKKKILQEMIGLSIVATIKLDGSSMTLSNHSQDGYKVCSRNKISGPGGNDPFNIMAIKLLAADLLPRIGATDMAIQGELVGPKINGNHLGLQCYDYSVFDVWDIAKQSYLGWDEAEKLVEQLRTAWRSLYLQIMKDDTEPIKSKHSLFHSVKSISLCHKLLKDDPLIEEKWSSQKIVTAKDVFTTFLEKYQLTELNEFIIWKTVPLIYTADPFQLSLGELQKLSDTSVYSTNGLPAEGIVVRTRSSSHSKILRDRLSVKVMSQVFAAKYKE